MGQDPNDTPPSGKPESAVQQEADIEARVALLERILHALLAGVGELFPGAGEHQNALAKAPGVGGGAPAGTSGDQD